MSQFPRGQNSAGPDDAGSQSTPVRPSRRGPRSQARTGPVVMVAAVLVWGLAVVIGIVAWLHRPGAAEVVAVPPSPAVSPSMFGEDFNADSGDFEEDPVDPGQEQSGPADPKPDRSKPPTPKIPSAGQGTYDRQSQSAEPSSDRGTVITYDVRVEQDLPYEAADVAETIHAILDDERSWTGTGKWRFELVGPGEEADLHAYLVTPKTTDKLCAPLLTGGEVSCRNGDKVVLNAKRWAYGAPAYGKDLDNYRRYLVNHEFGHALGFGHVKCPGPGRPAPIMMQQTKGLDECRTNPWPAGDD